MNFRSKQGSVQNRNTRVHRTVMERHWLHGSIKTVMLLACGHHLLIISPENSHVIGLALTLLAHTHMHACCTL